MAVLAGRGEVGVGVPPEPAGAGTAAIPNGQDGVRISGAGLTGLKAFEQDYGCVNAVGWLSSGGFGQVAMVNFVLMVLMAVGMLVRWKDTPVKWLVGMLTPVLLGTAALAVVAGVAYGDFNWAVLATFALAAWVLLAGVRDIFDKTRHKGLIKGLPTLTRSYWGMQLAHLRHPHQAARHGFLLPALDLDHGVVEQPAPPLRVAEQHGHEADEPGCLRDHREVGRDRHRRIASPTFWIWLYVSVTGVVVYILLYQFYPNR